MLTPDMFGLGLETLQQGPVWLLGPLVLMSCLWIELSLRHLRNEYRPTPLRLAQEIVQSSPFLSAIVYDSADDFLQERMPQEPADHLAFDKVQSVSVVMKQPEDEVVLSRKRSSCKSAAAAAEVCNRWLIGCNQQIWASRLSRRMNKEMTS